MNGEREIMEQYTMLFYGGIALMAGAGVSTPIAAVLLVISGRRLKAQLEEEYGPRRRRK